MQATLPQNPLMKTKTQEYGAMNREFFTDEKWKGINYNPTANQDIHLYGKRVGVGYSIRNKPTYIM